MLCCAITTVCMSLIGTRHCGPWRCCCRTNLTDPVHSIAAPPLALREGGQRALQACGSAPPPARARNRLPHDTTQTQHKDTWHSAPLPAPDTPMTRSRPSCTQRVDTAAARSRQCECRGMRPSCFVGCVLRGDIHFWTKAESRREAVHQAASASVVRCDQLSPIRCPRAQLRRAPPTRPCQTLALHPPQSEQTRGGGRPAAARPRG
jgi:hypothetical protein